VTVETAQIEAEVRSYLLENHLFTADQAQLTNDASLLEKGIIDSTGILEVIMFLESQFAVTVKDSEMLPENFDSVNNIVRFIQRQKSAP
jgi:acyl carrier protein